jgi:lipoate-protein ligase A
MSQSTLRIIHDGPLTGPENMARDEALLNRVGRGESPPTLRFYQWDPPTISLGYFQKYTDYEALPPPAGDLAVVRRQTGGGAILHDQELTYSITVPLDHKLLEGGPNKLYERAHDAIIAAFETLKVTANRCGKSDDSGAAKGPFFCFERRHCLDVLVGTEKLAGSAQRRTREAVLQHGSIILANRYKQQITADVILDESRVLPVDIAQEVIERLSGSHETKVSEGKWSSDELTDATELFNKHRSDQWVKRL